MTQSTTCSSTTPCRSDWGGRSRRILIWKSGKMFYVAEPGSDGQISGVGSNMVGALGDYFEANLRQWGYRGIMPSRQEARDAGPGYLAAEYHGGSEVGRRGYFEVDDPSQPGSPPVGRSNKRCNAIGDFLHTNQRRLDVFIDVDETAMPAELARRRRELARR